MSGPCLTDAAPETAPGGLFLGEKPLCGGPNVNLSGRCGSLRRWCHLHLSIALCHDVRSSASWPAEISVSPTTKRVNRIDYASRRNLLHGACGVSPQDRRELGDVAAQGREGVKES